jgi:flagellar basal body-associated protein FliL
MSDEETPEQGEPKKQKKAKKKKSKKKLIAIPVVLLLVAGVGYKMVLAPKPKPPKMKIEGAVVELEKEFVVNLEDGHYGKVSVALVVDATPDAHGEVALHQEPVIRAIITDELTGLKTEELTERTSRDKLLEEILETIEKTTDEHVTKVYFTDLAVQ